MNSHNDKVLVTGGAGYIGSTVCSALEDRGLIPIILDNLSSGLRLFSEGRIFYEGDIADTELLTQIFKDHPGIKVAIHCAALVVVPDSVTRPDVYYRENVAKSLELFNALRNLGCSRLVFSSSAAVYAASDTFEVKESSALCPSSPYARTKYITEMILEDLCRGFGVRAVSLRYFNPIGADPKLRSGPYVSNATHVLGRMVTVSQSETDTFEVTGTNWPTRDGSGIRDYIHVWDLAVAHVKAVEKFDELFSSQHRYEVINLGTGRGVTVKELVSSFETVLGRKLRLKESAPRPGDVAGSYASADKALALLNWKAELSLDNSIASALAWTKKHALIPKI